MKFSVGYQLFSDDTYIDKIIEHRESISEVYFSWGDFPNGRNNQTERLDMTSWEAGEKQRADLKKLTDAQIPVNMLFNATCYGKNSLSRKFFEKIGDTVDFVMNEYILKGITTTSPVIAGFIKNNFESLDVRASVNMSVGSVEGMEYIADVYDSFYVKRELNRDFAKINQLKSWCEENGKTLYALANSGCLNNCSAHTFHDNLVSHESEISEMDNGFLFEGVCKKYLTKENNIYKFFENTSFIRPEDVYLYEGIFPSMKLATRVNENPFKVIKAYIEDGRYTGSIMSLLEPNHTSSVYPYFVENSNIKSFIEDEKLQYSNENGAIIKLEDGGDVC